MKIVFLLEEESMKNALEGMLPRLLPEVEWQLIKHNGRGELKQSIPIKLAHWNEPDVRFIVVMDQERHPDCRMVKAGLVELCAKAKRPDTLVRIVCRALESWFLADLAAVEAGLGVKNLAKHQAHSAYKAPDSVIAPAEALKRLVPCYQKCSGARSIGPKLDLNNTRSQSFHAFVEGVRRVAAAK
jgi:hypothetical protein